MAEVDPLPEEMVDAFLRMLAPFAPHVAAEMWSADGREGFVSVAPWPSYDEAALQGATEEYAVQVNGKVRGHLTVATDTPVLGTPSA